jgi:large conductance mechanosensitive channel
MVQEFKDFISKGNLIEIAVGLILALAFAAVVTAFTNVVLSFVAAIFGGDVSFDQLVWRVNGTPIPYGAFLTASVNFVIVAWILFLIVKAYNHMKAQPGSTTKTCPFCRSDVAIEATRCPACTSDLSGAPA